ncbi:hypothetical protein [Croceibacterium aestuarii]|uniref:hypothetical protein n=1 Tax=Croceibacterium aestuarii TaxID=3064139 RepID=UPI00272EB8C0|nr:hypothetical protein [Croceibacterium sp. D39]
MAEDISETEAADIKRGAARAQAAQRLQVGLFGLGGMILLIGVANIIMNQALEAEATVVPEAAATVAPKEAPTSASDPLADAGVGPDLPSEPLKPPAEKVPALGPTNAPPTNTD